MVHVTANFWDDDLELFNEFREADGSKLAKSMALRFLTRFALNIWKDGEATQGEIINGHIEKTVATKDEYILKIPDKMKARIEQLADTGESDQIQTGIEQVIQDSLRRGVADIFREYTDAGFISEEKTFQRPGLYNWP